MALIKFTPVPIEEKKKRGKRKKTAVTEQKLEPTLFNQEDFKTCDALPFSRLLFW